jgi:porin
MNEFAHGKGSQQFLNPALSFNPVTALTVPYSTLGVTAIILPSKELLITAGVLDPHGDPSTSGFDTFFEDGASFVAEGRYTTKFFGKTGHQLLGGSYSTSSYTDLDQRVANLIFPGLPTKEADSSWSAYWNADQYFYQPDTTVNRGVGVFARFGISDGEANPIENFASIGIGGKGVVPGRENDGFGLGYFYSWIADNRLTSRLGFEDAEGLEAYYEIALTPALRLTPDIQWIQPSQQRVDSSWIAGLRLFTAF